MEVLHTFMQKTPTKPTPNLKMPLQYLYTKTISGFTTCHQSFPPCPPLALLQPPPWLDQHESQECCPSPLQPRHPHPSSDPPPPQSQPLQRTAQAEQFPLCGAHWDPSPASNPNASHFNGQGRVEERRLSGPWRSMGFLLTWSRILNQSRMLTWSRILNWSS